MHLGRRLFLLTSASLFFVALPRSARAEGEQCASDPAPAKCYANAAAAIRDSKPHEAAELYLKSYKLEQKIDPLAGYGFALALDNQPVAAAEVLEKAVEEYEKVRAQMEASNADANTLFQVVHRIEFVKDEINKMLPKLGKVQLKVAEKGKLPASITAVVHKHGNELHGSDPTVFWVTPNTDTLVFTFPSGRTLDVEVNVPAGTISTVDVPADPGPPKAPPPPPPPPKDEGAKYRTYAYISGGIGAVALVGGIGYVVAASGASAGVTAGLIGVGFVGLGAGVYFYLKADKLTKASLHPNGAPATPPKKHSGDDDGDSDGDSDGESSMRALPSAIPSVRMVVPLVDEHTIGIGYAGTL